APAALRRDHVRLAHGRTWARAAVRLQARGVAEMLFVAFEKLGPGVGMALPTQMLERISGRDAPDLRTDPVAGTARQALQQAAAKGIADAGGVDNLVRRNRLDVHICMSLDDRTPALPSRDDECATSLEDRVLVHTRLLTDQFELVIVCNDDHRPRHPIAQVVA